MPAYFSVNFQFNRNRINKGFVNRIYSCLLDSGLTYIGGAYEDAAYSYDEIVEWNQQLLEDNFDLGYDTPRTEDYKQVLFKHELFYEIRGFWINYPEDNESLFCLIVPETDVIEKRLFKKKEIDFLLNMACIVWGKCSIDVIQTATELDDYYQLNEAEANQVVAVCPFAIIRNNLNIVVDMNYHIENVYPEGRLLVDRQLIVNS